MEGENEKGKKGGQGWKEGIYFPLRMASLQIASDQGRGMGSTREGGRRVARTCDVRMTVPAAFSSAESSHFPCDLRENRLPTLPVF